jgi:hypothetical protein
MGKKAGQQDLILNEMDALNVHNQIVIKRAELHGLQKKLAIYSYKIKPAQFFRSFDGSWWQSVKVEGKREFYGPFRTIKEAKG